MTIVGARYSGDLGHARGVLRVFVLLVGTILTTHARATEGAEPAALNWVRAPRAGSCPGPGEVARAVEERLGRPALVPPGRAELTVEAFVAPLDAGGFGVTITLNREIEGVGQRVLTDPDPDCRKVASAAALAIALMIDPEAALHAPKPETRPGPVAVAPPPAAQVQKPPMRPAVARPEKPRSWQGDLELSGAIASGLFPRLAAGVFARGRVSTQILPVALELHGGYFPELEIEAKPGKGGRFELVIAGASACSVPGRTSRITGSACAGAELGSIAGQGYGFADTPQFRTWLFALAARARLWFRPRSGLAIVTGPGLAIPIRRDRFETYDPDGRTPLFRIAPVELRFELGAVWEL
jgi:hypothetical protein